MALKETTNSTKHPRKMKLLRDPLEALQLQPLDRVNGAPPLPILPESA
jgi:hypothetical protein